MRVKFYGLAVIAIITLALVTGCGKKGPGDGGGSDPDRAAELVAEGNQYADAGDWAKADSCYQLALTYDSNNTDAQFGTGLCQMVLLKEDPEIEEIIDLIDSLLYGGGPPKAFDFWGRRVGKGEFSYEILPFASFPKAMHSFMGFVTGDIPAISEIQELIDARIIPVINYVLGKFEWLELYHPDFRFYITPGMGSGIDTNIVIDSIEIDIGDIYVADAGLRTLRGILGVLTAYNFDVNYDSLFDEATCTTYVMNLIDGDNAFFTLYDYGTTKMSNSRTDLLTAIDKVGTGVTSIQAETDDQDDDLIPKMTQDDYDNFMMVLDTVETVLTVPYTVTVYDTMDIEFPLTFDIKQFFLSPIDDWKEKLPNHHWDWEQDGFIPYCPITFPDPEFNDIFPGMTNDDWRRLVGNF